MKKNTVFLFLLVLLVSCSSKVEEIKNPITGKLALRYEYKLDKDHQKIKDGKLVEWNSSGLKIKEAHYKDGKLNGKYQTWSKDGVKIIESHYKNGELDGKATEWNNDGTLFKELNYSDDKLEGKNVFHMNDSISRIFTCKSDIEDGPYFIKSNKNIMLVKGEYKENKPSGTWIYYNQNKQQKFKIHFIDGYCKEFLGKWKLLEEKDIYYSFGKDGSFKVQKLLNGDYLSTGIGKVLYTNHLIFTRTTGAFGYGKIQEYEIININKNEIKLAFEGIKGRRVITLRRV